MKFNWADINRDLLTKTKGKNIDGFRFYSVNGKNYPSITTVLGVKKKKDMQGWRNHVGEDVANYEMRRAAARGKATHNLVENYIKGEPASDRGVLPLGLFRLMKPYLDQINNIHLLETIMYSDELTIAGQVDCIAEYNGELSVIDFKTANKERRDDWQHSYFLQCTAYAQMYKETFGTEIKNIIILSANEDGTMQVWKKNADDYMEDLKKQIADFYVHYEKINSAKAVDEAVKNS